MVVLNLDPITTLTRERFYQLCLANSDVMPGRWATPTRSQCSLGAAKPLG